MEISKSVYMPFENMSFTYNRCFLCGLSLENGSSNEHIFPKWLLTRYGLWNQRLTLLNGTLLPYRQMTIPCCSSCNNHYLSSLERCIENNSERGIAEFRRLDEIKIYQWVAKIFYGILFKELSLFMDRRNSEAGFITSPQMLERYFMLHLFLQSVRLPFNFVDFRPWSIFIVETHTHEGYPNFDYHDNIALLTFAIRIGSIGVIACLEDNGLQKEVFSGYLKLFEGIKLHPIQFDELFAKITYQVSLMNRTPKYMIQLPDNTREDFTIIALPIGGMSLKPIYDEWNNENYASMLELYWRSWRLSLKDIFVEPDKIVTYLEKEPGTVHILNAEGSRIN